MNFVADLAAGSRDYEYSLAAVTNLRSRWFPTLEFNARQTYAGNAFYVTPGFVRHFRHQLEAGAGVSAGSPPGLVEKISREAGGDQD
ncbi:MAG TPA: hypothetical protein VGF88_16900 [Acidobacteriaceae bacterium]